jgi:hypothetical protein
MKTSDIERLIFMDKSIEIKYLHKSSLWYRLGLALSDGSILSKNSIIFSTSRPHTINAIMHGFDRIKIYLAKYMISVRTRKIIPIINIVVKDPETATLLRNIKEGRLSDHIVNTLINNKNILADFLAGVIDGDGSVDHDNIRICISKRDPLYSILRKIFEDNATYDEKRYILRISTRAIRELGILDILAENVVSCHKKSMIKEILGKRKRFDLNNIVLITDNIEKILNKLDRDDIKILALFKFRRKQKYIYAYVSFNKENKHYIFGSINKLLCKIGSIISQNLVESVKEGKREYIIYNQKVVMLIKVLNMKIKIRQGR